MANFDAAKDEESVVNVGAAFEANAQSAVLVQPAVGGFDHPAGFSQSAAVGGAAACQDRLNMPQDQLLTVRLRIVCTISLYPIRTMPRPARLSPDLRNGVDQGQELGHVVAVGGRNLRRQ